MKTMWPTENAMTSRLPWNTGEQQVRIDHLRALTGRFGLFEHAPQDVPPVSPGYTTDDNARALAVLGDAGLGDTDEAARYLRFVLWARVPGGWHNRMSPNGAWLDDRGSDDAHGRALWGLGTSIAVGVTDREVESVFLAGLDLDTSHRPRQLLRGARRRRRAQGRASFLPVFFEPCAVRGHAVVPSTGNPSPQDEPQVPGCLVRWLQARRRRGRRGPGRSRRSCSRATGQDGPAC